MNPNEMYMESCTGSSVFNTSAKVMCPRMGKGRMKIMLGKDLSHSKMCAIVLAWSVTMGPAVFTRCGYRQLPLVTLKDPYKYLNLYFCTDGTQKLDS